MNTADEIAAAFGKVDEFLLAAGEVAPWVELLLTRAAENGVSETKLTNHLGLNATVVRWLLKLATDATTDRSIDLEAAGDDLAELVLRWARS
jgi:hypothetical protein